MTLIETLNKWEEKAKKYEELQKECEEYRDMVIRNKEEYSKKEYERKIDEADEFVNYWYGKKAIINGMLQDIKESIGLK